MIVFAQPMTFTRVEHQLHRLAAILERAEVLHRLADRHALVAAAAEDQEWRGDVVDEGDRRALAVELERLLVRHATEEGRDVPRNIRRAIHAHEIGEPGTLHRRPE